MKVTYLTVQSKAKQHEEEHHGPELGHWHVGKGLWRDMVQGEGTMMEERQRIKGKAVGLWDGDTHHDMSRASPGPC
ncbi:hypothetical protein INR49_015005 [Caranx melampygus]|nr:hypothetical protein INR49_015005 [Caranx melampygus]